MKASYYTPNRQARECKYWWFDGWDWLVNSALRLGGLPKVSVNAGEIAFDPHIHTLFSHCSISRPDRIILRAAKLGLGAIGIMDHHDVKGALDAMRCAEYLKQRGLLAEEFLVIPGVEMNSSVGHVGALFVQENLPEKLSPEETVRVIHEAGGVAVAVHPYHSTGIRDAVFDAPFDAVETECGAVFQSKLVEQNRDLTSNSKLANIAKLGASDAHYINAIAGCYSVLAATEPTLDAARQAILDGNTSARSSESVVRIRKALGGIPKLR